MSIVKLFKKLLELIKDEGPVATLKRVVRSLQARIMRWSDRRWECRNHVRTVDEMSLDELTLDEAGKKHGFTYVPSFCRVIHNLIWNVEQEIDASAQQLSDFVFIDYGSGKGQALMSAAKYPFKQIIGVEFSPELHQLAEQNLVEFRAGHPYAPAVKLLNMDAAEFDLPNSPCVLYFYNPFDEFLMQKIINKVHEHHQRTSSPVYFLYAQLSEEDPEHVTRNISIISGLKQTCTVPVGFRSVVDRFLLASHQLSIQAYTDT